MTFNPSKISLGYLKEKAEVLEQEIEDLKTRDPSGCPNCGFLTQKDIDKDQETRIKVTQLIELTEVLDYLEERQNWEV
jgi:transposase